MNKNDNLPYSDKYRPRKLEDLIIEEIIYKKIKNIIDTKDVPNIIFTGNSGVGKTSTTHCIARVIYPRKSHENSIIEINASDKRGIKSVHDTIENFCKRKVEYYEGYAQHKLLILDEADNITPKAQRLINSLMEKFPTTRFVFTCNNSADIIESIQSRCIIIRFTKPPLENYIIRIKKICEMENIKYDSEDTLQYLFDICLRDLRRTLNTLELVHQTYDILSVVNINEINDIPSTDVLQTVLNSIMLKNVREVCIHVRKFKSDGYYSLDVLLHFIQFIKNNKKINEDVKIKLINILAKHSLIMSKSCSNYVQLTGAFLSCVV